MTLITVGGLGGVSDGLTCPSGLRGTRAILASFGLFSRWAISWVGNWLLSNIKQGVNVISWYDTSQIQLRRIPYMYTANFVFSQLFLFIKDMYPGPLVIFLYCRRMEEQTNSVNLLSRCPDNYHLYHLALVLLTQILSIYSADSNSRFC